MQKLKYLLLILPLLILTACPNVDPAIKAGRDAAAAGQGAILAAQAQCKANPSAKVCPVLPQAAAAQNLLVTSLETACGWNPAAPPSDPNAKCVVVQGALPALNSATANLTQILTELNGAMK